MAVLFSWDACEKDRFESIRRGADFDALVTTIRAIGLKKPVGPDRAPVLLFTLRPENIDQLVGTITLAARSGIRRVTVNLFRRADGADWTAACREDIYSSMELAQSEAARVGVDLALPDHLGAEVVTCLAARSCAGNGCSFAFTQAVVRYNGDVTPCNMMNPYLYGNIRERGFMGIWNDAEAKTFRECANTPNRHPVCCQCYYVDLKRYASPIPASA